MNGTSYRLAAASRAVVTCVLARCAHVRTARDAAASRHEVPFITARSFKKKSQIYVICRSRGALWCPTDCFDINM